MLKDGVGAVEKVISSTLKSGGLDVDAVASAGKVVTGAANTAVNTATPVAKSLYKVRLMQLHYLDLAFKGFCTG